MTWRCSRSSIFKCFTLTNTNGEKKDTTLFECDLTYDLDFIRYFIKKSVQNPVSFCEKGRPLHGPAYKLRQVLFPRHV